MNYLQLLLAAQAFREGRAQRSSLFRHRRLVDEPLMVVLWQLGAEPFTAAALGWGTDPAQPTLAVAGEPRNRDLAFELLGRFARWFNPRFEAHFACLEPLDAGSEILCACSAPQVVLANNASLQMLGRLGRRLAYLPLGTNHPQVRDLIRLGRHLLFLADHASYPGQQLVVSLTELIKDHWVTPQSEVERQSLATLDAFLAPPDGMTGFAAAAQVEGRSVGPLPAGEEEERLDELLRQFHLRRGDRTAPEVIRPLLKPIEEFYGPMVKFTWELLWRVWRRERGYTEAPSVERRRLEDRLAYTRHMDWLQRQGLRRTRQSPRQAALLVRRLEEATRILEAEQACEDPLRMIPYVLNHRAVEGTVIRIDREYRERAKIRMVKRPLVTLRSPRPCLIPVGKELYWSAQPEGKAFEVREITPCGRGCEVTLMRSTSDELTLLPAVGLQVCFSVLRTGRPYLPILPARDPWTHQGVSSLEPTAIEN